MKQNYYLALDTAERRLIKFVNAKVKKFKVIHTV